MFVEKQIESVIRDQLVSDFTGMTFGEAAASLTVRTFWAESAYDDDGNDSEVEIDFPVVYIATAPNVRESGHVSMRVITLSVTCMTQFNDDYDRNDLATIYETARKAIETTTFNFGDNIDYSEDSYEITDGSAAIEDNIQQASFQVELHICAGAFQWVDV